MGSISLNSVGFTATTELFSNLNLVIGEGDRVGLVAGNGGGKTTLLRCHRRDAGAERAATIIRSRGLRVGYVEQDVPAALSNLTLRDAILDALPAEERDSDAGGPKWCSTSSRRPTTMRERAVAELSGRLAAADADRARSG